mmetsp:Transcript_36766/g.103736  ORF Transcript_36766/g.103736 Transcript_36766/m.103736 type:complete len:205 (+) Transcript_36766:915-1529(+)
MHQVPLRGRLDSESPELKARGGLADTAAGLHAPEVVAAAAAEAPLAWIGPPAAAAEGLGDSFTSSSGGSSSERLFFRSSMLAKATASPIRCPPPRRHSLRAPPSRGSKCSQCAGRAVAPSQAVGVALSSVNSTSRRLPLSSSMLENHTVLLVWSAVLQPGSSPPPSSLLLPVRLRSSSVVLSRVALSWLSSSARWVRSAGCGGA